MAEKRLAESCDFYWRARLASGDTLQEVKSHLAACSECQKSLAEEFQVYQAYHRHNGNPYKFLPPNLTDSETFLAAIADYEAMMDKQVAHCWELFGKKLTEEPTKVIQILQCLFLRVHLALAMTAEQVSVPIRQKQFDLVQAAYQNLLLLLDKPTFAWLMGLDCLTSSKPEESLEWLARHWREILLGKTESGQEC